MPQPRHPDDLYKRVVAAKRYIDRHCTENICLDLIAANACFSKFHFIRLFTRSFGITPHQYLTQRRLSEAKRMLADGSTVTETCDRLGFNSLGSFTKLFKRHVKMSPSAFTSRHLIKQRVLQETPMRLIPDCFIDYMGWRKAQFSTNKG